MINYKEEFHRLRRQAQEVIEDHGTHENYMLYVSGTRYGIGVMKKQLKKYREKVVEWAEFEIIDEKTFEFEMEVYELLKFSLERAEIY